MGESKGSWKARERFRGAQKTGSWQIMGRCQRPLLLLLLPALLRTAASRCLHDETQKSVNLLRPPSTQAPPKPRSSALSLSASYNPQPLRIQTCYIVVPTSDGTWDPRGDGARGRTRALDAVREATRRIQGFLAGEWKKGTQGGRRAERSGGEVNPAREQQLEGGKVDLIPRFAQSFQCRDPCF